MSHHTPRRHPLLLAVAVSLALLGAGASHAQDLNLDTRVGVAQVRSPQGGALQAWRTLAIEATHGDLQWSLSLPTCLATPGGAGHSTAPACGLSPSGERRAAQSRELELRWDLPWTGPLGLQASVTANAWHSPATPGRAGDHGSSHHWELAWPVADDWELWAGQSGPLARNDSSAWRSTLAGLTWHHASGVELELAWDGAHHTVSGEADRQLGLRLAWHDGPTRRWRLRALHQLDHPEQAWVLQAGLDWRF